jgi:hypothetical protein
MAAETGLSIIIENVKVTAASTDCEDVAAAWSREVRVQLTDTFRAAGYVVIEPADPGVPSALVTIRLVRCTRLLGVVNGIAGQAEITLQGSGRTLAQGNVDIDTSPDKNMSDWVFPLVEQVQDSQELVAFAKQHGGVATSGSADLRSQADAPSAVLSGGSATSGALLGAPGAPGPAFVSAAPQPNAYAIIIGIEKYSASLPPPTGARGDAERFSQLAHTSLGIATDHVKTAFDEHATKGTIERTLAWAQNTVPAGGRIYFYFSGHGAPDASGGTPYIVPTDGDPQYLDATSIPMKEVLDKLGRSKAREVLAIVDSCFSGAGGRSVLPPGARPIVRVREERAPAQLAIFSASKDSQISGPVPGGSGGLFTKFVVEGLGSGAADANGDGQISLAELSQWVTPRVAREARKDNRDQNPSLTVGKGLGSADSFIVEWGLAPK